MVADNIKTAWRHGIPVRFAFNQVWRSTRCVYTVDTKPFYAYTSPEARAKLRLAQESTNKRLYRLL